MITRGATVYFKHYITDTKIEHSKGGRQRDQTEVEGAMWRMVMCVCVCVQDCRGKYVYV